MEIIKKYWREIAIFILIAMVAISVKTCKSKSNEVVNASNAKDSAFHIARTYINRHGELIHQVSVQELTIRDLKRLAEENGTSKEELIGQVGNLKNLVGFWKGKAGFKGKDSVKWKDSIRFVDKAGVRDTIDFKNFSWSNKYLTINEDYYLSDNVVIVEYQYDLGGFDLTTYRKKMPREKGKVFRKKQLVADLKFGDPNMKVGKFEAVVVKEEKKLKWYHWFLLGVGGGIVTEKLID